MEKHFIEDVLVVRFDSEKQRLELYDVRSSGGRNLYTYFHLSELEEMGQDNACSQVGTSLLLGLETTREALFKRDPWTDEERMALEASCQGFSDYELAALVKDEMGQLQDFYLLIKKPSPDYEKQGDCFSEVYCPLLFGDKPKKVFGVDGPQAYELARKLVRQILEGWVLVDQEGNPIEI